MNSTRRSFLGALAAAPLTAKLALPKSIGAELYTTRTLMPKEDEFVIRTIAEIGYTEVEGDYPTLKRTAELLKKYKLAPTACHLPVGLVTGTAPASTPTLDQIAGDLKPIGVRYLVLPFLQPAEYKDGAALCDQMNKAGKSVHAAGLEFAYHNHAFEFDPASGKRLIDLMMERLDPKLVKLEVDVFWVGIAGGDPAKFIADHASRVALVHLKDKPKDMPAQYNQTVTPETFKEVGNGSLDFKAILQACQKAGVKHYYVEQDRTPASPLDSLRQSFENLKKLS